MDEEIRYLAYLVPAFSLVWAVLFGYVLWMARKQKQIEKDIRSLKEELEEQEAPERVSSQGVAD